MTDGFKVLVVTGYWAHLAWQAGHWAGPDQVACDWLKLKVIIIQPGLPYYKSSNRASASLTLWFLACAKTVQSLAWCRLAQSADNLLFAIHSWFLPYFIHSAVTGFLEQEQDSLGTVSMDESLISATCHAHVVASSVVTGHMLRVYLVFPSLPSSLLLVRPFEWRESWVWRHHIDR